ncbi:histidine kinase-like protein [Streptomyces avidinii]|nr:histidine kinase-like protein [Streptomyces avidinii]SNX73009.1 Histidine kinase-like ATPase domain-containing protein [Streptomyces microflavus]
MLLSPTRRGARLARLLSTAHLGDWGLPTGAAAHIVAELATNAVLHGRAEGRDFRLRLTVHRDAVLRIEVTDARGERLPPAPGTVVEAGGEAESGRGLLIVGALADRWGIDAEPALRKTVWAELDLVR